nr:hypothetical protein [Sphingomonas sp. SCN 67-18]
MTPRTFRKRCLRAIAMTAAIAAALPAAAQAADAPAPVPAGFTSLFDGKTLNGWRTRRRHHRQLGGRIEIQHLPDPR